MTVALLFLPSCWWLISECYDLHRQRCNCAPFADVSTDFSKAYHTSFAFVFTNEKYSIKVHNFSFLLHKGVISALYPFFYGFPGVITHTGCWENIAKADLEATARDLQAFRVFSQHPKWVDYAEKSTGNVVHCFYKNDFSDRQLFIFFFFFSCSIFLSLPEE